MHHKRKGRFRVGTSGYQYDHWRDRFYPTELKKSQWFNHYTQHFDTVELNNTFYRLPEAHVVGAWHDQAPSGFCFALKYSRYGSHMKHLKDPEDHLDSFVERIKHLKANLGPVLLQLPPTWHVNAQRLDQFLQVAPRSLRWAVEFRHPSWLCDEVYAVLQGRKAALCVHDMIKGHPEVLTADWTYLRFHGSGKTGNYSNRSLMAHSEKIRELLDKKINVFTYFNNDAGGYAPANAKRLRALIEETTIS